jgi:pentatricopeptide repeat protein
MSRKYLIKRSIPNNFQKSKKVGIESFTKQNSNRPNGLLYRDRPSKLLHRLKDDWKVCVGCVQMGESRSGYEHTQEAYDMLVDRLGKMKQMGKMKAVLEEMGQCQLVGLSTVAKVMRRFAGAGQCEEAVSLGRRLMSWELWGWRRIQSL